MSLSKGKSFRLEVKERDVVIFKVFLPFVLFGILIPISFFHISKAAFYFLYWIGTLLTIFYISYVCCFYIKNTSFPKTDREKLGRLSFLKFFKTKDVYIISTPFYLMSLMFWILLKDYNFSLGVFSLVLGIGAYSTRIIMRDFLAQRKISIIEIITIFIVTLTYLLFRLERYFPI